MRLSVIYNESDGVLTHAERDFYLAFCSFADNKSGFAFAKLQTVSKRAGMLPQSGSRMYQKLAKLGFLEKVQGGHLCLIGYDETKHVVKLVEIETKPDVKPAKRDVKSTKHVVKSPIYDVLTTHKTTHPTKSSSPKSSDLTPEQKQAFNLGMKFLSERIGKFPDGAAQGKALKWMLTNGADITQIQKGLERQIAEFQGRYRATYTTLAKSIFQWIHDGKGEILTNGSNQKHNGNGKPTTADRLQQHGNIIDQYPTEAELRH